MTRRSAQMLSPDGAREAHLAACQSNPMNVPVGCALHALQHKHSRAAPCTTVHTV
eukprot:CAMPEP_0181171412 /NCGR_PEP_ID=MMETSP1096-20121128/1893_1 /TAXON_ID=156174 ORGANISM="Chrysochromulina ericina, Strain CCMP281" /NCGR_SAMPLE_ID=MMETSP1096 /ASSEMBLY_ACC=CAM_ASM_000453 /LENGTH=54 /DNA_ID=CAMNT_0023259053 /DNA_START=185 /DNA_END=349 /DNA_ORIENTATION=-